MSLSNIGMLLRALKISNLSNNTSMPNLLLAADPKVSGVTNTATGAESLILRCANGSIHESIIMTS